MARMLARLSSKEVAHAKPPKGKDKALICDGGGLHLQVSLSKKGDVHRSWCFKYELLGRRRDMGLGPYPDVSLAVARAKAGDLRAKLRDRIDPLEEKAKAEQALIEARAKATTFRECAEMYHKLHRDGWTPKHAMQWIETLKHYAFPSIGKLAPGDIDSAAVLKIVEPQWATKNATMSRVLNRIEVTLDYAQTCGFRTGDNPARNVLTALPKKSRIAKTKSHPALPYVEVGALMHDLVERSDDLTAMALRFLILTASRSGEVLGMVWSEIDFAERTWVVPSERMKARREHKVPLSSAALLLLKALPRTGDRVFPISERRMALLLHDLRDGATVHGFRSSFRDWCADRTNYPNDVVEQCLAHTTGDATVKAYKRTDLFDKRRKLMQAWSDFCSRPAPTGAVVTPIRQATGA